MRHLHTDSPFRLAIVALQDSDGYVDALLGLARDDVNRRAKLTPDRRPKLTPLLACTGVALAPAELVGVVEPGRARWVEERPLEGQARFLKRQLSLPVSTMSQWCVRRSSNAVVILGSPKTVGHSPKARLVVTMIEVRS